MSRLVMIFEPPFQRVNVIAALQPMVGVTIPADATVKLAIQSRDDLIEDVPNSDNDLVTGVTIAGFSSIAEITAFLNALPSAVDTRLVRMQYHNPPAPPADPMGALP